MDAPTLERLLSKPEHWTDITNSMRQQPSQEGDVPLAPNSQELGPVLVNSNNQKPKLHQPLVLRFVSRIIVCLILTSLIVILEQLLQHSNKFQGLGEVRDSTYFRYLWTTLPTFVLSLLSKALSAMDSEYRIIAPYYSLSRGLKSLSR
jgi:hypothetical protein